MRCSPDPRISHVCALMFFFASTLVLPNKIFAHNSSPESQLEACAALSLRQVSYRIEPPVTPGFRRSPALALGDLNQDGRLDFLTGALDVSARFLNRGDSTFQILPNLDSFFQDAAIADFNQDGYADVALLNADVVNVNLGYNPTWPAVPVLTATVVGRWATTIRAGDFNRDGKFDLAVVNTLSNAISVLFGKGDGNFSLPVNFDVQENPHSLVVNDFNGDGRLDLATVNEYSETVSILSSDGNGGFTANHYPANSLPQEIVAGDFNRDGKPDLAVTNRGWHSISILQNDGSGGFTPVNRWDLPFVGGALTANDFNRDGYDDVAVAHYDESTVRLFFGDGNGGYCSVSQLDADLNACCSDTDVTSADLNADGAPELIFAKGQEVAVWWSGGSVSVNTPPTITPVSAPLMAGGSVNLTTVVATVNDAETPAGNLQVALVSAPAGITINALTNNNGTLNATFTLECALAIAQSITIRVTDPSGQSATTNIPLMITSNTIPTLGAYSDVTLGAGNTILTPSQKPTDNGTIIGLTATASAYSGVISIDSQGVVTIANNGVAGKYQVVISATDNCFNAALTSFFFTISNSAPPATCETISFIAPLNYEAGSAPAAMATGDLNGDGLPDFAVANRDGNNVSILLGTNDGVRSFRNAANYTVGFAPRAVTIHDFNGDGRADVAVVNRGSDTVTILTNNGDGMFRASGNYEAGNKPFSIAVGDFNRDSNPDLVIVNDGLGSVAILDGIGDGSFGAPRHLYPGPTPQPAVVGDFNQDGNMDFVVANYITNDVTVMLGFGDGTFESPRAYNSGVGWNPSALALGDVNNDDKVDLVVAKPGSNRVAVLYGTGTGAFGFYTAFIPGAQPESLTLADFDNNGKLDLAVGNYQDNTVIVFPGDGRGAYGLLPSLRLNVGTRPLSLLSGDFNGDGKPDLSLANNGATTVSVLLNGCGN
jgi:FG-GAP-like repeat